ncbi:class I SAM-dependent methyltransferase [Cohnella sp. GbtcB17]|uniref:class I SAM-dependent methyltransferase n=1 Tax=Cohnella sp. GbtcB17 TaxID=2824762 RepID=UPI001C30B10F|nr:class I SAM-dependent methyltransferase [Cohnella sp. GbtcB17]
MNRAPLQAFVPIGAPVLEIGPLDKPFLRRDSYDAYYADVRETGAIIDFFRNDPNVNIDKVVPIDYVIRESYSKAVGKKKFAAIFHSHVIEHVPNIIGFLLELSEILMDDGKVIMAIPDKRGTFDWFRDVTPFRDAYDVYRGGSPARLAFDSLLNGLSTPLLASSNYIGDVSFRSNVLEDEARFKNAEKLYDDPFFIENASPHYWVFTGKSFLQFLRDGIRCKLFPFRLEHFEDKGLLAHEFHIVLTKDECITRDAFKRREEILKLNELIECNEDRSGKMLQELRAYCKEVESVYIYGCGYYGTEVSKIIRYLGGEINGFIVTDGFRLVEHVMGIRVYELSEIQNRDVPIVVALDSVNQAEVLPLLKERGFEQVFSKIEV